MTTLPLVTARWASAASNLAGGTARSRIGSPSRRLSRCSPRRGGRLATQAGVPLTTGRLAVAIALYVFISACWLLFVCCRSASANSPLRPTTSAHRRPRSAGAMPPRGSPRGRDELPDHTASLRPSLFISFLTSSADGSRLASCSMRSTRHGADRLEPPERLRRRVVRASRGSAVSGCSSGPRGLPDPPTAMWPLLPHPVDPVEERSARHSRDPVRSSWAAAHRRRTADHLAGRHVSE